jgi:hypothetical protein
MKAATKPAVGWRGRDRIITVILWLIPLVAAADEPRFTGRRRASHSTLRDSPATGRTGQQRARRKRP